jgi:hypothetical protein
MGRSLKEPPTSKGSWFPGLLEEEERRKLVAELEGVGRETPAAHMPPVTYWHSLRNT